MSKHIPVLLHEAVSALQIRDTDTVIDGTIGGGGHARRILAELGDTGRYLGIDRDARAVMRAKQNFSGIGPARADFVEGNFRDMKRIAYEHGIESCDAVLLDLGLSEDLIEDSKRGFSFTRDEPLLMTFAMDPGPDAVTARDVVNEWSEEHIADIIHGFGEERFARRIARAIVRARERGAITTSGALAHIVEEAVPFWYRSKRTHPATKTFQAIRMAVNDELGAVREGLVAAISLLRPGGRLAVISFHSGEDRLVKRLFREYGHNGVVSVITKRPIIPSREEVQSNKKARSAKLRICEKNKQ